MKGELDITNNNRFFKGKVWLEVEGEHIESFLNRLIQEGIQIVQLKRISSVKVSFQVTMPDIFVMKRFRKHYDCRIKIIDKSGFPKLYRQRKRWIPAMISIVIGFFLIFCLSNIIWNVSVEGGSPESRYEVQALVQDLGLEEGNWLQQTETITTIEREIMNTVDEVSYVGINRLGTSYYIQIEESEQELEAETEEPSHLVASKTGTIQSIKVTRGRAVVDENDFVSKGDRLISGILDEENEIETYSEGEVWAEVWYHLDLTIDLKQEALQLLPEPTTKYRLRIGNKVLWNHEVKEMRRLDHQYEPFYFFKWELPIGLEKSFFYDEQIEESNVDLESQLPELIESRLKRELGQTIELQYQKVLHEDIDSDKVKLEMFVKVLEDISMKQTINQGD